MSAAARISLIFFLIGALWVLGSDSVLLFMLGGNPNAFASAQTFKGWAFVGAASLALYLLVKREFDARRQEDERFRNLVAANPMPMWVYDQETLAYLDVNDAACAHYGYSREEFLAMRITDIRPAEEVPRLLEYLSQKSDEFQRTDNWRHRKKNGDIIEVESSVHTLEFAGRAAVLMAIQDVTERNRAEEARFEAERLRVQLAKETELSGMRTKFISMVSHEFRRPLTTITTSVELLEQYRDRMSEETEQKHFLRIHEQLHEMQDLLNDFLTLMRSEAAEQDFKPVPVDLTGLCSKLIDSLRLSSERHTLCYTTDCTRIVVMGDEKLLRQAIANLLTNAIKYSPAGSEVNLFVKHTDKIEIRVVDQGIGIPLNDQTQLFDPFYRASNVGETSGTGLGLPIAKQAMELHGGTLELARSDSSGSEFLITLPIDERTILTGC